LLIIATLLSLSNYYKYTNVQINSTEKQLLESNSTALADLPAHEIVFTDIGLKTMQVWTIKR